MKKSFYQGRGYIILNIISIIFIITIQILNIYEVIGKKLTIYLDASVCLILSSLFIHMIFTIRKKHD